MCSADIGIDPASQLLHWGELRDALNATGHRVLYSICPHSTVPRTGPSAPWWHNGTGLVYAPPLSWTAEQRKGLANSLLVEYTNLFDIWYAPHWLSWRNCPGPHCNTSSPGGLLTNIDAMVQLTKPEYSGPGSWADGDMLQVCNYGEGGKDAGGRGDGGMTLEEYRASLSIWAVLASPIIISADLRTLRQRHPECLDMLRGSAEVLAISQDKLGRPGRLVHQATNASDPHEPPTTTTIVSQVWVRDLEGGDVAAVRTTPLSIPMPLITSWGMMLLPSTRVVLTTRLFVQTVHQRCSSSFPFSIFHFSFSFLFFLSLRQVCNVAETPPKSNQVLFNRAEYASAITLKWASAGLVGPRRVRDVWRGTDLGVHETSLSVTVESHAAVVVRLALR
jgi:hypothetical protein